MEGFYLRGTPSELAEFFANSPGLAPLQQGGPGAAAVDPSDRALPGEIREWLDDWDFEGARRNRFTALFREVQSFPEAIFRITSGRHGENRFAGRVGFVKEGEREAFAFLSRKGRLTLRLDHEDADGFAHARKKQVSGDSPFRVHMYVRSEESLKEALDLVRRAYEKDG